MFCGSGIRGGTNMASGGPQFGTGFKRLPFLCIFIVTELLIILFDPFSGIFKSNGTRLDGSP